MHENIILKTDSYIATHHAQYPPGMNYAYAYVEARGGDPRFGEVPFFGLQYYLKRYLEGVRVTEKGVDEARAFFKAHFGREDAFDHEMWYHIARNHGGKLPIRIRAVAEGTVVPTGNVLFTIESTDPRCAALPGHFETLLLKVWASSTGAANSRLHRELLAKAYDASGTEGGKDAWLNFALHDFGYRGAMSEEGASLVGAAHLLFFMGTDTLGGITLAHDYYGAGVTGFSIPAMAHCTVTSWRTPDGEKHEADAFRNMLDRYPSGLVAAVSDSWNIYHAVEDIWGHELRDRVLARDGTVVIRPDSGDPEKITVEVFERLWEAFGGTTNEKGFRVLNPKVRVIHGDGISLDSFPGIITAIHKAGISIQNFAFGEGAGLHVHNMSRDTCGFAFKLSYCEVNGEGRPVFKNPIHSKKRSKAGRLGLFKAGDSFVTLNERETAEKGVDSTTNLLRTVFENGELVVNDDFATIRGRANA